jgi:hypothetical protein
MTKAQKAALRFAFDLLSGRLNNQLQTIPGIFVIADPGAFTHPIGLWIKPDSDPARDFLNEAIFSDLVVRGCMECRNFEPDNLWLYRITPEGCTAIGKMYPGLPELAPPRKFRKRDDQNQLAPKRPDHRDPHRFRRSNDWRKG